MHLNRFERLTSPVRSSEINEIIGKNVVVAQTIVSMEYNQGLKIWQVITRNYFHNYIEY
jgi:hypothetical protein